MREAKENVLPGNGHASFGLPWIDSLLGEPNRSVFRNAQASLSGSKPQGQLQTCEGSITFLLGDAGTHKGRLARRFLAQIALGKECGSQTTDQVPFGIGILITTDLMDKRSLLDRLAFHIAQDTNHPYFAVRALLEQQESDEKTERLLCRRLSVRHLSSAHFLKIVECQVRWAKMRLRRLISGFIGKSIDAIDTKFFAQFYGCIRLVIDDWHAVLETHPNLAEDPLLVQSLITFLKREGITALLVSTQPGQPYIPTSETPAFDLRKIDEQHIYTWGVSFYGQRRTAITCLRDRIGQREPDVFELLPINLQSTESTDQPWISLGKVVEKFSSSSFSQYLEKFYSDAGANWPQTMETAVREAVARKHSSEELVAIIKDYPNLRRLTGAFDIPLVGTRDECLSISREFGLYGGVEIGEAYRVPLRVQLVEGIHGSHEAETFCSSYPSLLNQTLRKVFPSESTETGVSFVSLDEYDEFATYADWLDDSRGKETVIIQIDEFWGARPGTLMELKQYWIEDVVAQYLGPEKDSWISVTQNDVYGVWHPHVLSNQSAIDSGQEDSSLNPITVSYYRSRNDKAKEAKSLGTRRCDMTRSDNQAYQVIDRIPYYWDFGFLVADRHLWEGCKDDSFMGWKGDPVRIAEIWNALALEKDRFGDRGSSEKEVSWIDFFTACERIASRHPGVAAFDINIKNTESMSCLLLEVWGSISKSLSENPGQTSKFQKLNERKPPESTEWPSLKQLFEAHTVSLLSALISLLHACKQIRGTSDHRFEEVYSTKGFVASRQWYSTASAMMRLPEHSGKELCLLSLPGNVSTRGDWYLAVTAGSRSRLLAERAIDLMTSRKMNVARFHDGLGLPVRDVLPIYWDRLSSPIVRHVADLGEKQAVTLGEIESLGQSTGKHIEWLWRSRIRNYDRDCFYLRRWLSRVFFERRSWFNKAGEIPLTDLLAFNAIEKLEKESSESSTNLWKVSKKDKNGETVEDFHEFRQHAEVLYNALDKTGLERFLHMLDIIKNVIRGNSH